MSFSSRCHEDAVASAYEVFWSHKYCYYFNDSELHDVKRASYPSHPTHPSGTAVAVSQINASFTSIFIQLLFTSKFPYKSTWLLAVCCLWVPNFLQQLRNNFCSFFTKNFTLEINNFCMDKYLSLQEATGWFFFQLWLIHIIANSSLLR